MQIGQRGTARNGQRGVLAQIFTNAVLFQSDTGACFTLLNCEFTPENATPAEVGTLAHAAAALFGFPHHEDGGFHYSRSGLKGAISHVCKRISRWIDPDAVKPATDADLEQAHLDISNGKRWGS